MFLKAIEARKAFEARRAADALKISKVSTGRTEAKTLKEKLAMEEAKSNPQGKTKPRTPEMSDRKNDLLAEDGWVKKFHNLHRGKETEIHYVENVVTKVVGDFKFP